MTSYITPSINALVLDAVLNILEAQDKGQKLPRNNEELATIAEDVVRLALFSVPMGKPEDMNKRSECFTSALVLMSIATADLITKFCDPEGFKHMVEGYAAQLKGQLELIKQGFSKEQLRKVQFDDTAEMLTFIQRGTQQRKNTKSIDEFIKAVNGIYSRAETKE